MRPPAKWSSRGLGSASMSLILYAHIQLFFLLPVEIFLEACLLLTLWAIARSLLIILSPCHLVFTETVTVLTAMSQRPNVPPYGSVFLTIY